MFWLQPAGLPSSEAIVAGARRTGIKKPLLQEQFFSNGGMPSPGNT
jgi:hypothetical protein